jgi:hypothetical protein
MTSRGPNSYTMFFPYFSCPFSANANYFRPFEIYLVGMGAVGSTIVDDACEAPGLRIQRNL